MKRTFVRYVAVAAIAVAAAGVVADAQMTLKETSLAQDHAHLVPQR